MHVMHVMRVADVLNGRVASETVGAVSKTEHRKLVAEVAQISTLRESNDLLRSKLGEAERGQRSTAQRYGCTRGSAVQCRM